MDKINVSIYLEAIQETKTELLLELFKEDITPSDASRFNEKISQLNIAMDNIRKISSRDMKRFYNA